MKNLKKFQLICFFILGAFLFSCEGDATDIGEDIAAEIKEEIVAELEEKKACSDFELVMPSGGGVVYSVESESVDAVVKFVEGATYEFTVNGVDTEWFRLNEAVNDLFVNIETEEQRDLFRNGVYVSFNRFEDAEVCVSIKGPGCPDETKICKTYKKQLRPTDDANLVDFTVEFSTDFEKILTRLVSHPELRFTSNKWEVTFDGVADPTFSGLGSTDTDLRLGTTEICMSLKTLVLKEDAVRCKKIVITDSELSEIEKAYKESGIISEYIRISLEDNGDGTLTPKFKG